ncbi:MAG: glutamate synthase large subunit [Roseovarius sp.]|nr:glutamate synthase large subunit [Roseovarius sp.]MCY4206605.1 glutamate synthase large subunit [Roseovarius sp.]MCY4314638.1 glutamate synthase large subunit [Roseovarius sp.]
MTVHDPDWAFDHAEKRRRLAETGMYSESQEHSSCGVGLVVSVNGKPSRKVVKMGINALRAIWHRGAVDADGKTGDGAGIHIQIPIPFFYDQIRRTGHEPHQDQLIAVGQIFLPRTDFDSQETCRSIVESEVIRMGHYIYGWRHVPVDVTVLGDKANATRPEIEQILISNTKDIGEEEFERELYVIRRRIEKAAGQAGINGMYVASLSCRGIIYKGMMLAEQVSEFYPDLRDKRFKSAFAIYHQRYSTNTFPQWWLAQPFRMLAHNGEINTLKGNVNWMKSHEIRMASASFKDLAEDIKPIVPQGSSDSAALDSVFEVLVRAGRSAPMAKTILIPESWSRQARELPMAWQDMYSYCNSVMEPWDGPAALAMTDGRWVCAGMDRNGLRPMRYVVTADGLVLAGSEAGMVPVDEGAVREKGALGPGQMLAVDMSEGRLYHDAQIKNLLAAAKPFGKWQEQIVDLDEKIDGIMEKPLFTGNELLRRQIAAGYTNEEMEQILAPMAEEGKEAVASMGDDTPSAVLSGRYRPLSHYFRQNFSQVTNPPIDSLREYRIMSLKTRFGNLKNVLDESGLQTEIAILQSPFLGNAQWDEVMRLLDGEVTVIDCTFEAENGSLQSGLERIRAEAEDAVRSGSGHIVLTDQEVDRSRIGMPMILATSAVHSHLTRKGLRTFCSLNIRSAECIDPHYFAVLIGAGATVVNAYLAEDSIADRIDRGLLKGTLTESMQRYRNAIDVGLHKIMAKMGISVISSYRGGLNFEAVGLSRSICAEYFPGLTSRISGMGISGIQAKLEDIHAEAFKGGANLLPIGGFYKLRTSGETHAWGPNTMHLMQMACIKGSHQLWKRYSKAMHANPPIHLRDLIDIKPLGKSIPLQEVESVTAIRKRFVTPGMSLGALSPEAHKTLNVAMNRIGARSDSGEGGEDPAHSMPEPNGDNPSAKIKQVASGRFGVTAEYLNRCEELEIKIAQGAKPGEGGQLPGMKVTSLIARLRHSTEGVSLISPPPHHDIYSIEDLAQLIYDLKQINPTVKVCVKLVAQSGVGTISAGVAKAKADVILISGHNGGTGASPATSIKYAGLPWEMGLTEAHQVLSLNNLRDRVILRTDGGLRTGRDIVIAAMMGAEEYGIGTAALIAMGCIMVRQCQSNTCPVGVCTQDERLREKFTGTAEKVVNLMTLYAQEVREILAGIGAGTLDEVIGRADLLTQVSRGSAYLDDLDLNPMLITVDGSENAKSHRDKHRNEVPDTIDAEIVRDAERFLKDGEKIQLHYAVQNTDRTVGARVSSHIVRNFGMRNSLQPDHLTVKLTGSAGQSLGAFAAPGLKIELSGDANDYVGKGLSGGIITVRPPMASRLKASENAIVGNTVLYGATDGLFLAAGIAGERFAVRNSGAKAVVEGAGCNGCEYMTGGIAVILGRIGANFAAGMTGGMAYIHDPENMSSILINRDTVAVCQVTQPYWLAELGDLIKRHALETGSQKALDILQYWETEKGNFLQVCPLEMLDKLPYPISDSEMAIPAE